MGAGAFRLVGGWMQQTERGIHGNPESKNHPVPV